MNAPFNTQQDRRHETTTNERALKAGLLTIGSTPTAIYSNTNRQYIISSTWFHPLYEVIDFHVEFSKM